MNTAKKEVKSSFVRRIDQNSHIKVSNRYTMYFCEFRATPLTNIFPDCGHQIKNSHLDQSIEDRQHTPNVIDFSSMIQKIHNKPRLILPRPLLLPEMNKDEKKNSHTFHHGGHRAQIRCSPANKQQVWRTQLRRTQQVWRKRSRRTK